MTTFSYDTSMPMPPSDPRNAPDCASSFAGKSHDEFMHALLCALNRPKKPVVHGPHDPIPLSHEGEVLRRMNLYCESGNRGYLIDAAKYIALLWEES